MPHNFHKPVYNMLLTIEHSVQVLADVLDKPPMRAFLPSDNLLFDALASSGQHRDPPPRRRHRSTRVPRDVNFGIVMKGCHWFNKYTVQVRRFAIRDSSFRRMDFSDAGLSHICVLIRTNIGVIGHTRERNTQKCSVDVGARTMIPVSRLAPSLVILLG
jgi:hypothetical protein